MSTRTHTIPNPNGPRSVVSTTVENQVAGPMLSVLVTPLDLTDYGVKYEVPMTWEQAIHLFNNLAGLITTRLAIRESER